MSDHLYPARPGMLRRGTPVVRARGPYAGRKGVCTPYGLDSVRVHWGDFCEVVFSSSVVSRFVALDIDDVFGRAHAAMPYTVVSDMSEDRRSAGWPDVSCVSALEAAWVAVYFRRFEQRDAELKSIADHIKVLVRMRCLDESVTVEEARAALDWAHSVTGGEA